MINEGIKILTEGQTGKGLLVENDAGFISHEINKGLITESNDLVINGDSIFINCILQKAEVLNQNGRIYPRNLLDRELNKYMQFVKDGNAIGERDHSNTLTISLANIPFRIIDFWWEGDTVYGKLEIFLTKGYINMGICSKVGDEIAEDLRHRVKIGISSRGLGSVKDVKGKLMVQEDFQLVCFDLVASPSTPNAYLFQSTAALKEEKNLTKNILFENKLINFLKNS